MEIEINSFPGSIKKDFSPKIKKYRSDLDETKRKISQCQDSFTLYHAKMSLYENNNQPKQKVIAKKLYVFN